MVSSRSTGVSPTGYVEPREGRPTSVRPWPWDRSPPRASSLPRHRDVAAAFRLAHYPLVETLQD
eukprot:282743-Pleurochrysis_carterae.AAC.1